MPYGSVIAAVMGKYGTLIAANFPGSSRPPIWLDMAPQEGAGAAQQKPPYVIITDGGGTDNWDTEVNSETPGTFSIEVYYAGGNGDDPLGDADMAMKAILWNGSNPNQVAGIAFMTPDLAAPYYGLGYSVKPTTGQRSFIAADSFGGRNVYVIRQDFEVTSGMRGTG